MRSKLFLISVIFLILQVEFKCYVADQSTSENPLEATTKKSGFFKGIKKFFGGGKTTEAPITPTTITTTTSKPTTTTQRAAVSTKSPQKQPAQQPFGADLPGFPPRQQNQPNKPGLTALSYPSQKPVTSSNGPQPAQPITSSTTTTTTSTTTKPSVKAVPTQPSSTTTTTKKHEDFPALPTKKPSLAVPTPTPALVGANAWTTPTSPTNSHVSFITTPKTVPSLTPSTTHKPVHSPASVPIPSSTTATKTEGKSLATDKELSEISEEIFAKETGKLNHLHLNIQGKTKSHETKDEAPAPLFKPDSHALESNSISKMMLLFNNYELDTTVNEHVTPMERNEENQFVDIIMVSGVMRKAMSFLEKKGLVSPDPAKHKELVKTIWFTQYSRGLGKIGSSAFEHVFLSEIKNGTIIGLHNWIYFMEQEKAGKIDYMGYMRKVDLRDKAMVLETRFAFNGLMKPFNGMFIGTSPEFEIALYTICFLVKPDEDCHVTLGGEKLNIVTHTWKYRGNKLIGSAYPNIL